MSDLIREAVVGRWINYLSGGRLLPYADQRPDYVIPSKYLSKSALSPSATLAENSADTKKISEPVSRAEPITPKADPEGGNESINERWKEGVDRLELEQEKQAKAHGFELVDWDSPEDPENPQNWSNKKKGFVGFEVSLLTFSVYIGSAIYTSSIPNVIETFNVTLVEATLGLTLYVVAYGMGPMILSPIQELPSMGRNPVYIYGLLLFVLFNLPIVFSNNFGTLLAFRFLTGFVGSPALATGGASISDVFSPKALPYMLGIWSLGAVAGPITGPVIGGFAAQANGYKWPIYELLWISGFSTIFLGLFFPETYAPNILLRKAQRLRKLTGNQNLRSQSEIDEAAKNVREIAYESLIRPFQLAGEPAILFSNIFIGLIYSVFYLWFEAFPLVFTDVYGFNLGLSSLPFLGFIVSGVFTYGVYCWHTRYILEPKFSKGDHVPQEVFLDIGFYASWSIPISLFIFGWTARPDLNWMGPIVGASIYLIGIYLCFQSILMYVSVSYPKYVGSVLAGNDLFRSSMASVFPLFGRFFFERLGLGGGSSFLAGISIILSLVYILLMKYGHNLRARSKYAESSDPKAVAVLGEPEEDIKPASEKA